MFLSSRHHLGSLLLSGRDPDSPQPWTLQVQIPATLAHGVAIFTTTFRLLYRWYLARISWEDGWATLALMCGVACLASVWIKAAPQTPHSKSQININSNWLLSLTITAIVWFSRMSILSSVVRIANPTPTLRLVAYCIGAMFLAMEAGLLAQKIYFCVEDFCEISTSVATAQLVTDIISDIILVAVPIRFLRGARLRRDRRILIISAFSASILISGVTILHSVLLFQDSTDTTLIIGHIKAALALLVCNALVLVTFLYRLCRKPGFDPECSAAQDSGSDAAQFTTVFDLPSKSSSAVCPVTSGVQCTGDAPDTKAPTLDTSPPSELDPSHTGRVATPSAEDSRCHHHVYAMDANDE